MFAKIPPEWIASFAAIVLLIFVAPRRDSFPVPAVRENLFLAPAFVPSPEAKGSRDRGSRPHCYGPNLLLLKKYPERSEGTLRSPKCLHRQTRNPAKQLLRIGS